MSVTKSMTNEQKKQAAAEDVYANLNLGQKSS